MMKALPYVHTACQGEVAGYLYRQRATSACGGKRSVHEIVRLFDETVPMFASMSAENRKCLSGMLERSILYWRSSRDKDEIGGGAVIRACVMNARKNSAFLMSELPAKWRPGFAAMLFLHTFLVVDLLLYLQPAWGCARRWLNGIICSKR